MVDFFITGCGASAVDAMALCLCPYTGHSDGLE